MARDQLDTDRLLKNSEPCKLSNNAFQTISIMINLPSIIKTLDTVELPANQQVFSQGQTCQHYIVLISGQVRVFTRSANGKEVVLYRMQPGEMCVLTAACLLGNQKYPAEAITETAVEALMLSHRDFDQLVAESPAFRQFVFQSFSQRLADLMAQLEHIALESVDQRLARYLLENANEQGIITTTHQDIASNIGSVREVVSRHLKTLEKQSLIILRRGSIELLEMNSLQTLISNKN